MKSIEEKAEEYTSDITNPVTNCAAFLAYKRGANYVLEEIDEFMKDSPHVSYTSYTAIKEMIEQLKK